MRAPLSGFITAPACPLSAYFPVHIPVRKKEEGWDEMVCPAEWAPSWSFLESFIQHISHWLDWCHMVTFICKEFFFFKSTKLLGFWWKWRREEWRSIGKWHSLLKCWKPGFLWIPLFPHLSQFMPVHEHFTYVSPLLTISTALALVQAPLCFTQTIILCKSFYWFYCTRAHL